MLHPEVDELARTVRVREICVRAILAAAPVITGCKCYVFLKVNLKI